MNALSPILLASFFVAPASCAAAPTLPTPATQDGQVEEQPTVEELVKRGRALIAEGKGAEARTILLEADAKDGGAFRTRMWLVRALIEIEYLNDALNMTDDAVNAGASGLDVEYLYGMAFAYKARKYLREGVNMSMIGMHYGDAVGYLRTVTQADAERYGDAFLPLAESAWNSQQLEIARGAAESAVARGGSGSPEAMMLGEVAFSQFVATNADEARREEADAHWQAAYDAFTRVCDLEGRPRKPEAMSRLGRAHKKCADALVWKTRLDEAAAQYALAMGWDPTAVDYGQVLNSLGNDRFLPALEEGAKNFTRHHRGEKTQADATLMWWLGWARFNDKEYEGAKEAFELAYSKWPAYQNCLWYIGLCHFNLQEYDAAASSVVENFQANAEDLAASINANPAFHLSIVDSLVGHCAGNRRQVDAAVLSEAQAKASPQTTRYWNNAGLFYRDAGDALMRSRKEADRELRAEYYELALARYEAALALEPDNPALLNDTAVVLHYNLGRDLERALRMYERSFERAVQELERKDLTQDVRALYEIARRDSRNNKKVLEALLESRRRDEEKEKDKGGDGQTSGG